jgi:hypothetical protein
VRIVEENDNKLAAMLLCRDIWVDILKKFNSGYLNEHRIYHLGNIHYIKEDVVWENKARYKEDYPNLRWDELRQYNNCPACLECFQDCTECFLLPVWMGENYGKGKIGLTPCETSSKSPYYKLRLGLNNNKVRSYVNDTNKRFLSDYHKKKIKTATRNIIRGIVRTIKNYGESKSNGREATHQDDVR